MTKQLTGIIKYGIASTRNNSRYWDSPDEHGNSGKEGERMAIYRN